MQLSVEKFKVIRTPRKNPRFSATNDVYLRKGGKTSSQISSLRQATHNHSTICYSTQQDNPRTRFSAEMMADIEFRVSQAEEDRVLT